MNNSSSTENVVGTVSDEVKEENLSVLQNVLSQAEDTISSAKAEAQREVERILAETEQHAETLNRRIISSAELNARNLMMEVIEDAVNQIFNSALEKMKKAKERKDYEKTLKRFLEEGIESIGGEELIVLANSDDVKFLKKIVRDLSKKRKIPIKIDSNTLNCVGGVIMKNSDGSIIYDNTIEARFKRMKPLLRKKVSDLLRGKR